MEKEKNMNKKIFGVLICMLFIFSVLLMPYSYGTKLDFQGDRDEVIIHLPSPKSKTLDDNNMLIIRGKVVKADGSPIEGAIITLEEANQFFEPPWRISVSTNANGEYEIKNRYLEQSVFFIIANKEGYKIDKKVVIYQGSTDTHVVNFILRKRLSRDLTFPFLYELLERFPALTHLLNIQYH